MADALKAKGQGPTKLKSSTQRRTANYLQRTGKFGM